MIGARREAEDAEGEPPDRTGHSPAVERQVVEALIGRLPAIHLAAVDQLAEGVQRYRIALDGVGECQQHRVVRRCAASDGMERRPGVRESNQLLRGRGGPVADVVDSPGEGVEGGHGEPLLRGEQADAIGEILGLAASDLLTALVGVGEVHHRRPLAVRRRVPALWTTTDAGEALTLCETTS